MNSLLVGCGNLGNILLHAWSSSQLFANIIVLQPSMSAAQDFKQNQAIKFVSQALDIPSDLKFDITVLAIKPQIVQRVMPEVSPYAKDGIIVSLLAGVSTVKLASYFKKSVKIVRIMPNIAIKVGQSTNLAFAHTSMTPQDSECVNQIFSMQGKMIWLTDEQHLDILTPISGSGPAYFLLMAEILTQITIRQGISEPLAKQIVQQTLCGTAALANEGTNFESLITAVASKGGVTEAALRKLRPKMPGIMEEALLAAFERLKELSS